VTRERRLRINPQVLQTRIDGGCVLIDRITGECYELNRVGAVVWSRLHAGESVATMTAALAVEYGVSVPKLEADLDRLMTELLNHGLLLGN
jgi:hypothetical protein